MASGRAALSFFLVALAATVVMATQQARAAGLTLPQSGAVVSLQLAGDVAVSPSGSLFVAAPAQHEILELGADGKFRAVAGTGRLGPGSDGPALRADLSAPYDLTFDGRGDLYFADAGRIWVTSPSGRLAALAGNGQGSGAVPGTPGPHIANGSPALAVSLGSQPYFALAPDGIVVIDTPDQLLRLTSKATLVASPTRQRSIGPPVPSQLSANLGPLAFDAAGDLFVSGFNGWSVWRVHDGIATYVTYARRSGGNLAVLREGPGGAVYAGDGSTLLRVSGAKPVVSYDLSQNVAGEYFWLTWFAFAPDGTLYADEIPGGGGFEKRQQLIAVHDNHVLLIWEQPPPTSGGRPIVSSDASFAKTPPPSPLPSEVSPPPP
jgi:hypothetical protein